MKNSIPLHWTDFHENLYLNILRTSVRKTRFSLKSDKNNRYFIWRTPYLYIGRIFTKFYIWIFFEHLSGKLDFRYNRTKITGTLFEELRTFTTAFRWILLRMGNVSEKKVVEKTKTHISCSIAFFFENLTAYEIMR